MLGGLADGVSRVRGFLPAGDTLATLDCMRRLGVEIETHDPTTLTIQGRGMNGLQAPNEPLDCVNAGTGIRLLAGILAGQKFASVLDGSEQLRRRPMKRITEPLRQMGAHITDHDGRAPLHFSPAPLHGIHYQMPIASGQVKSCLLLAGLFADSPTTISEPGPARDHTERMLQALGVHLETNGHTITVHPAPNLSAFDVTIPGDMSSAAFMLVAGALCAEASVEITHVNINPTRTGILSALQMMGFPLSQTAPTLVNGEPVATVQIEPSQAHGIEIGGEMVVRMIDEFPALMVAATQAEGRTHVCDARELRVKETDRIAVMAQELRKLDAIIEEHDDGFSVNGPQALRGAVVDGHDDHRVAMSLVVAGLVAKGETYVNDAWCINDSFPGFVEALQNLGADVAWV
jgi:3-phosphoshikimate 1-carboxyvinyltransferase